MISVNREKFLKGLATVQGVLEKRQTVPILGHVLIEPEGSSLKLAGTDLEVGLRTRVDCQGDGKALTLNARKLFEVVRAAEGETVTLEPDTADWVNIKCGRSKFRMMGLDPRSFPAMPTSSVDSTKGAIGRLMLSASILAAMLDRTTFATDNARYNLSGVHIECHEPEKVRLVATDGHRLSLVDRQAPNFAMEGSAIIPLRGLIGIRKLIEGSEAEVTLALTGGLASLALADTEVLMRLVEGEFPDYRGVIPKQPKHTVRLSAPALLAAVRRAALFSNERYQCVKLAFSEGSLVVSSNSPEAGSAEETIDAPFHGQEFSIGFNARYLVEPLAVFGDREIDFCGSDEQSPVIIRAEGDDWVHVVMPRRL